MSYHFYGYDFFTGRGIYDLEQEHYWALLQLCLKYCSYFSILVAEKSVEKMQIFESYSIEKPDFPYQNESLGDIIWGGILRSRRQYYRVCDESIRLLYQLSTNIFELYDTGEHNFPEDPVFYRADGSVFFNSVIHEWECHLFPHKDENIDSVLQFGHWLYKRGGTVWKEGEVSNPADDEF